MAMTATRITGIPITYSLLTDEGHVYIMYAAHQIELLRTDVGQLRSSLRFKADISR